MLVLIIEKKTLRSSKNVLRQKVTAGFGKFIIKLLFRVIYGLDKKKYLI
jgi:hypothetical protein